MLVELSLYAGLAFSDIRTRAQTLGNRLSLWLVVSAIVPYLIHSLAPAGFNWVALLKLLVLAGVASLWFVILPHRRVTDVAFLLLMAAVYMAKLFHGIYPPPVEGLRIEVLGQLMWIRIGISAMLLLRRMDGIGFGFWPNAAEWRIGFRQFVLFMPAGLLLMYGLEFARFDPSDGFWWKAIGTFFGILWVVALSEEFFFRGMLQRWLVDWLGIKPGLILTALLFGAVHLPFREFPNWSSPPSPPSRLFSTAAPSWRATESAPAWSPMPSWSRRGVPCSDSLKLITIFSGVSPIGLVRQLPQTGLSGSPS